MSPQVKATADARLVTWIARPGGTDPLPDGPGTVAAYMPVGTEPGTPAMLDALRNHGHRVLLPVVSAGPPAPLRWSVYDGRDSLSIGRFGLLEPTGATLSPEMINSVDLILVPALAVDRSGVRLGRGAGYYDRTIHSIDTQRLVAVVFDHEMLDTIPGDDLDVPIGWSLSPTAGFRRLGTSRPWHSLT